MLEHDKGANSHLAASGGVIMLEHVNDGAPEKLKVFFRETSGLASQICGNEAFATIQAVGNHILPAHLSVLFSGVVFLGDCHARNGDLLRDYRVDAAREG